MLDLLGLLGRGCLTLPNTQITQNAVHGFLPVFKMQPFEELVKEDPPLLLLSIEPQECSLSPGNGPE